MITVRLKGGMGNQMFQYAFARALAERNGDFVVLDVAPLLDRTPRRNFVFRGYDLDIFNIDARLTLFSRVALRLPMPMLWAGMSVIVTFLKLRRLVILYYYIHTYIHFIDLIYIKNS